MTTARTGVDPGGLRVAEVLATQWGVRVLDVLDAAEGIARRRGHRTIRVGDIQTVGAFVAARLQPAAPLEPSCPR